MPYAVMAVVLFLSRMEALPFKGWLLKLTLRSGELFGTNVSTALTLGYLPGTIFILAALVAVAIHGASPGVLRRASRTSFSVVAGASAALLVAVPMVKIFIGSGAGIADLPAMPKVLAQAFADGLGSIWPVMASVIGALGAFIAGSNTLSNMMFSLFQYNVATISGLNPDVIVAVQSVGAAAGNMICVHNVIMASAAVGLLGREGDILRKTLLPATYYILGAGAAGYLLQYGFGLHFGTLYPVLVLIVLALGLRAAARSGLSNQ